ncbi:MAG: hypothetical protein ACD_11C00017G0027 [uncultured bacterium]|nr:MAG: hypothetical protein ACD_11C00017G0027 [uncultured bacterium]HBR71514.1 pyruvate ferredoxin oxidoreductase [Candidatus Moranbacteria bacterium]
MKNKKYTNNNKNIRALTGGSAAAEALRQMNPDVMAVYPITPQTPIIETYAKMKADGKVQTEIIQVESEHSAMSAVVGAQAAGARTVTATSSQGLVLMHEILYIAAGLQLPSFMYVSARALAAPLNIHGEHGDVMAVRDSGWAQIFSENAQQAYDLGIIGLKLAEKMKNPVMTIMDGFHTSHTTERVEVLEDRVVKNFVGEYKPEKYLLDFKKPLSFGVVALQNSYFEFKLNQIKNFEKVSREYKNICKEFEKISGRKYGLYEDYELDDADYAIVILGSTAGTAKETVDKLRSEGKKVGLLSVHLFRPFQYKEIGKELAHIKKIAVLDRAVSVGAYPPLYGEVVNSLYHATHRKIDVASYVYGLGGRDTFQKQIKNVFDDLENGEISEKIKYIL